MNTENDHRIDTARVKQVYGAVFGWEFKDYGPGYTSFHDGRLAGGFTTDARPAADGSTSPTRRATCWVSGPSDAVRPGAREFAESQPGGPTNEAHGAFAVLPERAMAR